jgi:uncharacterized protein (DUF2267 family)
MDHRHFVLEIAAHLRSDAARAEGVAVAVLQELRDRLTPKEAADVAAQLPVALKRIWLEGERSERSVERIHRAEFLGRVRRRAVLPDDVEAERAAKAVFRALQQQLGSPTGREGEAWDIFSQLPKDLKALWLEAAE